MRLMVESLHAPSSFPVPPRTTGHTSTGRDSKRNEKAPSVRPGLPPCAHYAPAQGVPTPNLEQAAHPSAPRAIRARLANRPSAELPENAPSSTPSRGGPV